MILILLCLSLIYGKYLFVFCNCTMNLFLITKVLKDKVDFFFSGIFRSSAIILEWKKPEMTSQWFGGSWCLRIGAFVSWSWQSINIHKGSMRQITHVNKEIIWTDKKWKKSMDKCQNKTVKYKIRLDKKFHMLAIKCK